MGHAFDGSADQPIRVTRGTFVEYGRIYIEREKAMFQSPTSMVKGAGMP